MICSPKGLVSKDVSIDTELAGISTDSMQSLRSLEIF